MSKLSASPIAPIAAFIALLAAAAPAAATVLGPHAAECRGGRPAMLVRIIGLKARTGILRVQAYDDPARFFEKGSYIERIEVRPPAAGPIEVCVPVARGGTYAVSVRHDIDGTGHADLSDGGGTSGNPNVSMMDVLFKRRPSPEQVAVRVAGVTPVPVILNYVQGSSVRPLAAAER